MLARHAFQCLFEVRADLLKRLLSVSVVGGQPLKLGLARHSGALEVLSRCITCAVQALQLFLARVERLMKRVTFQPEMSDLFLHLDSDAFVIDSFSGEPLLEECLVLARSPRHSRGLIEKAPLSVLTCRARVREITLDDFLGWRLPERAGLRPHPGAAKRARRPAVRPRRAVRPAAARRRGVGQPELERLPGRGRLGERRGELRFASNESLGRGSRVCRPGLLGLVECPFGVAHLLRERFAGRRTLRHLCVVLGLTLRELGGSRRLLRRLPPLRFLQRRLRVGQLLREDVAVGDFLSEPDFDLTLTP